MRVYDASEIDLLAAYVSPENAWYLFPVEEFLKYKSMRLYPVKRRKASKFEKFRENWGVVRQLAAIRDDKPRCEVGLRVRL